MRIASSFIVLSLFLSPAVFAEEPQQAKEHQHEVAPQGEDYICPMHPDVHGKKGGICPICGMTLVPAHPEHEEKSDKQGAVTITPAYQQALGVRTDTVAVQDFGGKVVTYGKISHSTRHEYNISVRSDGWVVDLPVSAIGDNVKKGDLLFTLYSPLVQQAQSDYFFGKTVSPDVTEKRLKLAGMDEQAIAEMKKKGKVLYETPFYAPSDGSVTILNARKGSFMKAGDTVVQIHDFSEVWAEAGVPEQYLSQIRPGMKAEVTVNGTVYKTAVDVVYPLIDEASRTVTVRMTLSNSDGVLKPGVYADVAFETDARPRLAVADQAVLHGKMGAYVIRAAGEGYFAPAMVKTGISSGGKTEIIEGLKEGESIVSSGQFMIDSESNFQGGMAGMKHE